MYVRYADDDSMTSMDAQKKNYLLGRLSDIETKKDHELSKKYNMYEDPRPDSAEELVERIKSGKFSITPRPEKGRKYDYSPMDRIVWRDPAAVKDEESYEKARDVLDLLKTKAQDQIWVGDDVTGLKALEEFAAAEVTIQ